MEQKTRVVKTATILSICTVASVALAVAGVFCALFAPGWISALLFGLTAALAVIACFVNARAVLAPTRDMERHFARIADGDLHTRSPLAEDATEIGMLAKSANRMQAAVNHYISTIESVLAALAAGDLSVVTDQDFAGDYARIRDALERITVSFGASFAEINSAADEMSAGAEQISVGASALSESSSEQAATIEELTSTMSEVSQRVTETVVNAEKVRAAATDMMATIREGNEALSKLSGIIEETGAYSSDIGDIVKVIDNIAFQTNILALNAAVEAARAGENGAAFGVVADEVRALATQTAQNAKTIARLIENAVRSMAEGVTLARATEGSLEAIIASADNVRQLVGGITTTMESDAAAVEESLAGLEQLSAVVQGTSATSEENAAASEEIAAQALAVKELVGKFKTR